MSFWLPSTTAQPQASAGVLDIDPDAILGRRVVAEALQPRRVAAAPAGRVDHQVGSQDRFVADVGAGSHLDPGDPVASVGGDQAHHLAPVPDRDVAKRADPVADLAFQIWTAGLVAQVAGSAVATQQVPPERQPELSRAPGDRDAVGDQLAEQPREQLVEDLRASR